MDPHTPRKGIAMATRTISELKPGMVLSEDAATAEDLIPDKVI